MPDRCLPGRARRTVLAAFLSAFTALPNAVLAADVAPGSYMLEGGSCMIDIRTSGNGIEIVEPNKVSPYARFNDDEFHLYSPNTATKYGIRYIDDRTSLAFKPDVPGNAGSRLVLVGDTGAAPVAENGDSARWDALAQQYAALIESDPDNVQSGSACAGVAIKDAVSTAPPSRRLGGAYDIHVAADHTGRRGFALPGNHVVLTYVLETPE